MLATTTNAMSLQFPSTSKVPEGGWTASTFRGERAVRLMRDFVNLNRAARGRGQKDVRPLVERWLTRQTNMVVTGFTRQWESLHGPLRKQKGVGFKNDRHPAGFGISIEEAVRLMEQVIWQEIGELEVLRAREELVGVEVGLVSDSAEAGFNLLGGEMRVGDTFEAGFRTNRIADLVTNITETTRNRMRRYFESKLAGEATIYEAVQDFSSQFPEIEQWRVNTIVRTEMGRAADEGTKEALRNASTVSEVSVVGCEAREDNSPQYRGESTCNIQNVPVQDIDLLEFHPNHTGAIVPSGFFDA